MDKGEKAIRRILFIALILGVGVDVNLDRDLQAVGLADLITSIGGGPVGYPSASLSILPNRIGARSHLVGVFVSILFALTLFVGGGLLAYLPRVVIGGLLVYFGVDLLYHWVIRTRKTLPKYDYYVLLLILLVIVAVDLLTGVVVGILAAVVLFAVNYSKTPVIRHTLSGETFRSNVERAEYHRQYLQSQGNRLLILRLQGFIFFGTAFQLFQEVRQRVEDPHLPPLDFLVMDFRLVSGADSSAMHSFVRMLQLAESRDFTLALSDLPESLREQIAITRTLIEDEAVRVRIFPDLTPGTAREGKSSSNIFSS
jgi:SulP family sulfate permease